MNLLYDPFGNYVFQKMIALSYGTMYFDEFIQLVAANKENLRSHKYGKKIIFKIANSYPELDWSLKLSTLSKFNERNLAKGGWKYSGATGKQPKKPTFNRTKTQNPYYPSHYDYSSNYFSEENYEYSTSY